METVKVYVSGWLEFRIDNPAALVDASKFTPEQLDPERASNLHEIDNRVWGELGNAIVVEVAKAAQSTEPPGVTQVDSSMSYSLSPPTGDEPQ